MSIKPIHVSTIVANLI